MALGVSQSGYYAWKDRPDAPRTLRRIWLAGEIADVHKASGGTYGALRVTAELRHGRGIGAGHNAIGTSCASSASKGCRRAGCPWREGLDRSAPWTGRRVFRRDGPNQLWMTDITEHPTGRASSTAAPCWTPSRGAWSAGRSTAPRPPGWSSTPSGWPPAPPDRRRARDPFRPRHAGLGGVAVLESGGLVVGGVVQKMVVGMGWLRSWEQRDQRGRVVNLAFCRGPSAICLGDHACC